MSEPHFSATVSVDAVENGKAVPFMLGGLSLLICNSQGTYFAVENKCSHADEPLACGRIRNGWIACPAHGARFDLATGKAMNPPAKEAIRTFTVRVTGTMIEVAL